MAFLIMGMTILTDPLPISAYKYRSPFLGNDSRPTVSRQVVVETQDNIGKYVTNSAILLLFLEIKGIGGFLVTKVLRPPYQGH